MNVPERLNKMRLEKDPLGVAIRKSLLTLTRVGKWSGRDHSNGSGNWMEKRRKRPGRDT